MGHELFRALFRRCTHEELRTWAKTFPWDHPIARKLDHEVHRRRMAGECYGFFFFGGCGSLFFIPFLIFSQRYSRGSSFYVLCCGLSIYVFALDVPDSIGPRGSGFQPVRVDFFCLLDSWEYVENQPVCHIYQWVAHPTQGGVCNHCERMMDGLRLDDVIAGNREGTLTEDEIVQYVQDGDPNDRDWDDWPLRMTFRINSFLRTHGPVGEPDLAALGFLDDD